MKFFAVVIAAVALFVSTNTTFAQSTQIGTLACSLGSSVGMIVGSRQRMTCVFHKNNGDIESYTGTFTRVGLDVGVVGAGRMGWLVFKRTRDTGPRALAGSYTGASGSASLGLGAGGNVLIGGFRRSITLQPISLEVQAGVNLALGVGRLRLQ